MRSPPQIPLTRPSADLSPGGEVKETILLPCPCGDRAGVRELIRWCSPRSLFNAGEFGAGVWWFSPDGKTRYKIAEAWVVDFYSTKVGLLALEGIAHGSQSNGRIIRLARDRGGRWRSEDLIDLKHAPQVGVMRDDGSLLIATTDRLLRVVPSDKTVEVLHNDAFWGGLYPDSLVVTPGGVIYLGMRHGVARIEKKGKEYQVAWLLPKKDFVEPEDPDVSK
jgi:hypothetical protein